jgi:hypothetical protein
MTHYLEVNGIRATYARVLVPFTGRWIVWGDLDGTDALPSGQNACVLTIGNTTFRGTYDAAFSGTHGLRRRFQITGGIGWERVVKARAYHNDATVKLSTVLQGLAAEVGETVTDIPDMRVPAFTRGPMTASSYLHTLVHGWYVDYAGVTHCRSPQPATAGEYELLEYHPADKVAVIATLDPSAVPLGAALTSRLDAPLTVRSLEITVEDEKARIRVWGM